MIRTRLKSSKLAPPVALLAHSKYSSSSVNEKLKTTAFAFNGGSDAESSSAGGEDSGGNCGVIFLFLFFSSSSFSSSSSFEEEAFFIDDEDTKQHGKQLFVVANRFPMLSFRNISGVHPSRAISFLNSSNGLR
jgi:hypothetical protein